MLSGGQKGKGFGPVVTTPIHDRMPVMLMPEDYDGWLDPDKTPAQLRAMLRPYHPDLLKAYAVSRVVNSVKNDTPECVAPIGD